jgi:hypothetical protein
MTTNSKRYVFLAQQLFARQPFNLRHGNSRPSRRCVASIGSQVMFQQPRLQPIPLHLNDPSGAWRERIANLRKMAREFGDSRNIVVLAREEEVASLERDDQTDNWRDAARALLSSGAAS